MTLSEMDKDLERFTDFEQVSERVVYWERRFNLSKPKPIEWSDFEGVVSKHSHRVLGIMRVG